MFLVERGVYLFIQGVEKQKASFHGTVSASPHLPQVLCTTLIYKRWASVIFIIIFFLANCSFSATSLPKQLNSFFFFPLNFGNLVAPSLPYNFGNLVAFFFFFSFFFLATWLPQSISFRAPPLDTSPSRAARISKIPLPKFKFFLPHTFCQNFGNSEILSFSLFFQIILNNTYITNKLNFFTIYSQKTHFLSSSIQ